MFNLLKKILMPENVTPVKVPAVGSLIKYKTKDSPVIWYVEVTGFYDILPAFGGGRGFEERRLNGTGTGCIPESRVEKLKVFRSISEMQSDIDNHHQKQF